ncbi:MAG: hypothetical protein R3F17_00890 [Planctomycetota bacterium]
MLAEVEAETPVDNGELLLPETGGALRMPGESVQPAITDRVELIAVEMPGESSTDSEEDAGLLPGDGEEKLAQLEWSIGEDANSDLPRFEIDELSIESEVAMLSPVLGSPNLWLGEGALSIDPTTQVDSAEVLAVEPGQDDPSLVAEGPVFEVDENLLVGPEPGSNPFGESALLTQETGENPATETSGADVQGELSPGTETPAVPEPVAVHGNPTVETPVVAQAGEPAEGQGGLLDLYAEWTVLDDQGQVQEMAPLAWMGTAGGPVGTLPFGVAQQGEGQPVAQAQDPKVTEKDDQEATTRRKGVLRRREQTVDHWTGTEIPMHALKGSEVLLTPNVGPVRVIATAGETIEGRLHGLGQGYVWLENNLGKMTVPARRIERIERIDPNQYRDDRSTQMDYTKLPKVRVRMKGGVFVGYQLAREGNRITIRTEQGAKLTLVSDDIRPAGSYKAVGLRRDGEAAESGDE